MCELIYCEVIQIVLKILPRNIFCNTRFFKSNTFISNARLKLAKTQVKAQQHPDAELIHPKVIGDILKNVQKTSASVLMTLYD